MEHKYIKYKSKYLELKNNNINNNNMIGGGKKINECQIRKSITRI